VVSALSAHKGKTSIPHLPSALSMEALCGLAPDMIRASLAAVGAGAPYRTAARDGRREDGLLDHLQRRSPPLARRSNRHAWQHQGIEDCGIRFGIEWE
jgi:hypothetical protein